ncbi:hypothetical protein ACIBL8_21415 [Streptomyces sp. NPDC050523]|uniref:hypothetical protein n=1 Tax=Streptomyces sp. NPDC050523 TaxID=3365622 RepID=UPI00379A4573
MAELIKASRSLYVILIVGAYVVPAGIVIAGVVLVALGATGDTQFTLFGQRFQSTNVGIGAIFIGGVVLVLLIRAALHSLNSTVAAEAPRPPDR